MSIQNIIANYCDVDDQIKQVNKSLKELKSTHKQIQEQIMSHMKTNHIEVCNVGDRGVLTLKKTMVKKGINKENIYDNLVKVLKNEEVMQQNIEQIAEFGSECIVNERESEEKCTLKRTNVSGK